MPGYKSVPKHIVEEIGALDGLDFRIGVTRVTSTDTIEAGKFASLGVTASKGEIQLVTPFLPHGPARWTTYNLEGLVKDRPDWPKRSISWPITSPNFGDAARNGITTRIHTVMAIAKQTLHAKAFAFEVTANQRPDGKVLLNFMLEPVFAASVDLDSTDLLMAVSLTREVVGTPRVFPIQPGTDDWQSNQKFGWEFLPVDHRGQATADYDKVADTLGLPPGSTMRDTFKERYGTIRELKPKAVRYGTTGFARYVAFEFDKAVVLENYSYGNAAYVMYEDWEKLSQRTRLDLLSDPSAKFERVIHASDWKSKLREAIKGRRKVG